LVKADTKNSKALSELNNEEEQHNFEREEYTIDKEYTQKQVSVSGNLFCVGYY